MCSLWRRTCGWENQGGFVVKNATPHPRTRRIGSGGVARDTPHCGALWYPRLVLSSTSRRLNAYHDSFYFAGVDDPADPFSSNAQANSWTPPLNSTWTWGTDLVYGVNLGGLFVIEVRTILLPFYLPLQYLNTFHLLIPLWLCLEYAAFHYSLILPKISRRGRRVDSQRAHGERHLGWRRITESIGGSL